MASPSQILAHIYSMTMLFFSILLLELAVLVRSTVRATTIGRSMTTDEFLKVVEEKAPARPFKARSGLEALECRVCLSLYEEGDEIRKLKCQHTFHKCCLDTWLQEDAATCPLCRRSVLPAAVVVKHRNHRLRDQHRDGSDEDLMLLYFLHGNFMSRFFVRELIT